MPTQKIAITVPPLFLKRLDKLAKKFGKARSRFIVEEMTKRIQILEDEEITRIYNKAYADPEFADHDYQLAEEMLEMGSVPEEDETW